MPKIKQQKLLVKKGKNSLLELCFCVSTLAPESVSLRGPLGPVGGSYILIDCNTSSEILLTELQDFPQYFWLHTVYLVL